jgi:hypothetical protein
MGIRKVLTSKIYIDLKITLGAEAHSTEKQRLPEAQLKTEKFRLFRKGT